MDRTLTVSQAARELGCSEKWLRNSEVKGKIPKARRDINGWRIYTIEDIEKIKRLLVPSMS
jgi:DNA-binding transcriptional MerR regulator